jgi:hypothetical protein
VAKTVDRSVKKWDIPTMKAAQLDMKRRLVMPSELRPGDPVTIQQVDKDSWLVRSEVWAGTRES